jgi:hypothetical protein
MGFEDEVEQLSGDFAVNVTAGSSGRTNSPHPCRQGVASSHRPILAALAGVRIRMTQLRTRRVSAAGLRLPQAKLSRNLNPVARGRIRRFESHMASQPLSSLSEMS